MCRLTAPQPLVWYPLCFGGVQRTHCLGSAGRRLRSASSRKLRVLLSSYCWSELREGCSGSCPGMAVERAPLRYRWASSQALAGLLSPQEVGLLGGKSFGRAAHTLALLELMADPMVAPVCSLERWHCFNVVANMPPQTGPRNQGFSPGEAASAPLSGPPEMLAPTCCYGRLEGSGQGICVYLLPGTGKVFNPVL